jgi:hypothetical protein
MSTRSNQIDNLVARIQPVHDADLISERGSAVAEALFGRIVSGLDVEAPPRRRSRGGRRRLLVPAAVGLATVGTVVAVAIGLDPSADRVVTPAAAALQEAAAAARAQDAIPPGAYLYVRSDNANRAIVLLDPSDPAYMFGCCEAVVPQVREMWLGADPGDALLRERTAGDPQFLSDEERERWIQLGRPELHWKTPFSGVLGGSRPRGRDHGPLAWYQGPLDLPSDADAVYEHFKRNAEAYVLQPGANTDVDVGGAMFLAMSDVLREARATPEQRAAAYEALARVPGVILVGEMTDRFGRRGVAVAMDYFQEDPRGLDARHVLIFDPRTAELLEERREVLPGNECCGLSAGTTEAYATYEYAVVGSLGERPPARG